MYCYLTYEENKSMLKFREIKNFSLSISNKHSCPAAKSMVARSSKNNNKKLPKFFMDIGIVRIHGLSIFHSGQD